MLKVFLSYLLLTNTIRSCPIKCNQTVSMPRPHKKCHLKTSTTTRTTTRAPIIESTATTTMLSTRASITENTDTTTTISSTRITTATSTATTTTTSTSTNTPFTTGKTATLTYFTDTVTQCYGGDIPSGNGLAINPLLLGFTLNDWNTKYANTNPDNIPWCGKMMNVTVNGSTFVGRIIDTCNPSDDSGAFIDPNTGEIIGGKCDYDNVIDLYGEAGLSFLRGTVGDDFYRGNVDWVIY